MKITFELIIEQLNSSRMDNAFLDEISKVCKYAVNINRHHTIPRKLQFFIRDIIHSLVDSSEKIHHLIMTNPSDFIHFLWFKRFLETFFVEDEFSKIFIEVIKNFADSDIFNSIELIEEENIEVSYLLDKFPHGGTDESKLLDEMLNNKLLLFSPEELKIVSKAIGIIYGFRANSITESIYLYYKLSKDIDMVINYVTMFNFKFKFEHSITEASSYTISQLIGFMLLEE